MRVPAGSHRAFFVKMRIDGGRAYVSGTGMEKEEAVELPPDVVLENPLHFPHLVADFVDRRLETKNYQVFNGRDGKVQDVAYTKAGVEKIERAGKTYEAVVLDCLNRTNGLKTRIWLDPASGVKV